MTKAKELYDHGYRAGDKVWWHYDGADRLCTVHNRPSDLIDDPRYLWITENAVAQDTPGFVVMPSRDIRPYEPKQTSSVAPAGWDYSTADALHDAALKAIAEYNEYIDRKPTALYAKLSEVGGRY